MQAAMRHAGVLLHPSSLPGPGPIGELGPYAYAFLEWMAQAGLDTWQVLPLHPVGGGNSPYGSPSAFAGDPRLLSLELLVKQGLLGPIALPYGQERADAELVEFWKLPLLRQAAHKVADSKECLDWAEKQSWLEDWVFYAAMGRKYRGEDGEAGWWRWPDKAAKRQGLKAFKVELAEEIKQERGLQYLFMQQWQALRDAAKSKGIRLVGDIPIFVSGDGCDTWAHRELFRLSKEGRPDPVAGVPPDYFSPTGQRWGNPVYDWEAHKKTDFSWWKARIRRELELVDLVRLDHFRGFAANWIIPASEGDARQGQWVEGPGKALFEALQADLGSLPLIAEDLGEITPDVEQLRDSLGLPGMKVLQFAFGGGKTWDPTHPFLPHNFGHSRWVVYTGTHDNDTIIGWYGSTEERIRHNFRVYCARDGGNPAWAMLREAWASVAELAVAPMQDILALGADARMNTPGLARGNWLWRLKDLPWHACDGMSRLGRAYGRVGWR
jgi:4-alpha-glucanotransferase